MDNHNAYMKRAIDIGERGYGYVNPNPVVGCVIVKNGEIIGEGCHERYGGPHAERNAIKNASTSLEGATMYVSLEPCSHYGKTPPCTDAIIGSGITKVYVATLDPNPLVSGRGVKILRDNDIEVHVGLMEDEAKRSNEIFLYHIKTAKPFITLKSAISLDGKIATHTGDSKWISNRLSRSKTHMLRHKYSAIMVGINTVITDNPRLNTRLDDVDGANPIKIVVDSNLRIPLDCDIIKNCEDERVIIATTMPLDCEKATLLRCMGVEVITVANEKNRVDLIKLITELHHFNIDSILLEGGGTLAFSALEASIVNKLDLFIAPIIIGGKDSKGCVSGTGIEYIKDAFKVNNLTSEKLGDNLYLQGYIKEV